jgi:hypothetical protein
MAMAGVDRWRATAGAHDLVLDSNDLRVTAGAMLGAALLHPLLGDGAGFACPLRTVTGIPCPLCGMTTSVVATVHGNIVDALAANPAGIVAVIVALIVLFARPCRIAIPLPFALLGLAAMWVFELFRFSVLPS